MIEKIKSYITDGEILAIISATLITLGILIVFSSIIVPIMILVTILIAIYLIYTRVREIKHKKTT